MVAQRHDRKVDAPPFTLVLSDKEGESSVESILTQIAGIPFSTLRYAKTRLWSVCDRFHKPFSALLVRVLRRLRYNSICASAYMNALLSV